jgi:glucosamine-6-phosphate deaminase
VARANRGALGLRVLGPKLPFETSKGAVQVSSVQPLKILHYDRLHVYIYGSNEEMGRAASLDARDIINRAVAQRGEANIILATGNSQLTFLYALRQFAGIEWARVRVFHMDEYVGIAPDHKASFPHFLREHFLNSIAPRAFFPIPSQPLELTRACAEYTDLLKAYPADMVALGWGENGHMAFNDPPEARFDDPEWVRVVKLAEASRKQQVGEGHFETLDDVPTHAITLTIPALLAAEHVLCIVPEARKALAVRQCLIEPVDESHPGSILRTVDHARLYLDLDSAARL